MDAPECKPMLGNFVSVIDDSGRGEGKDATKSNGGVLKPSETYRPLHLNPVFYDQDPSAINKRRSREKVRAAKLLLEDSNINEDEDLPVEVYYGSSISDTKFLKKMREKEKYEEENFTRLPPTKRERLLERRMSRGEFLDSSTRINHIRKLLESSDDEANLRAPFPKRKTKQKKLPKKSGRKGGKRRRF
uniref:Uncharacterized protein n=1 Tax=Schistocephalus solidus TaxID=70667 RepID=A0A0V0JA91_SCHSO